VRWSLEKKNCLCGEGGEKDEGEEDGGTDAKAHAPVSIVVGGASGAGDGVGSGVRSGIEVAAAVWYLASAMSLTMSESTVADPRYPIGKHQRPERVTAEDRERYLATLDQLPEAMRAAVAGLNDAQLDTPYREGGWTVRQVVHHVADSHANMVVRVRRALTEDWPRITPYDQSAWAELEDAKTLPVEWSLKILDGLHERLGVLLRSIGGSEWERGYEHPENGRTTVGQAAALYDWHSRHHVAHITELRRRMGW